MGSGPPVKSGSSDWKVVAQTEPHSALKSGQASSNKTLNSAAQPVAVKSAAPSNPVSIPRTIVNTFSHGQVTQFSEVAKQDPITESIEELEVVDQVQPAQREMSEEKKSLDQPDKARKSPRAADSDLKLQDAESQQSQLKADKSLGDLVKDFNDNAKPKENKGKAGFWDNFDDLNNTDQLEELADAQ